MPQDVMDDIDDARVKANNVAKSVLMGTSKSIDWFIHVPPDDNKKVILAEIESILTGRLSNNGFEITQHQEPGGGTLFKIRA